MDKTYDAIKNILYGLRAKSLLALSELIKLENPLHKHAVYVALREMHPDQYVYCALGILELDYQNTIITNNPHNSKFLKQAALMGDTISMVILGDYYLQPGQELNVDEAVIWYRRAGAAKSYLGIMRLYSIYNYLKLPNMALMWYGKLAESQPDDLINMFNPVERLADPAKYGLRLKRNRLIKADRLPVVRFDLSDELQSVKLNSSKKAKDGKVVKRSKLA